jgi:hypothetical protein
MIAPRQFSEYIQEGRLTACPHGLSFRLQRIGIDRPLVSI